MKKLSKRIREHALGPLGGSPFHAVVDDDVFEALIAHKTGVGQPSRTLTTDERRMFALFVSYAVESDE